MLSTIQSDFYGDNVRWFIGVVEDISDPLKLGRARVRIFGIHNPRVDEVPTADLPWAQPIIPTTEGGISGVGSNPMILLGSQVIGIFLDGMQSQVPVILGSMPHIELPKTGADGSSTGKVQTLIPEVSPNQQNSNNPPGSKRGGSTITRSNYISTAGAVGSDNTEKAFNFFISTSLFTPEQSAGICGNLIQESGMNPLAVSGFSTESSEGIAQWNPSARAGNRLGELKTFAARRNLDYSVLETQLQFIIYELDTISYLGMVRLKATKNIASATQVFSNKYERPNKKYAAIPQRIKFAQNVFESYYHRKD